MDRGKGDGIFINTAGIGIVENAQPLVTMRSKIGTRRIVDMLSGEQLPRIY